MVLSTRSHPLSLISVISVLAAFYFLPSLGYLPPSFLVTVLILLSHSFFSGFNFLSFVSHVLFAALLVSVLCIFSSVGPRSSLYLTVVSVYRSLLPFCSCLTMSFSLLDLFFLCMYSEARDADKVSGNQKQRAGEAAHVPGMLCIMPDI